MQKQISAYIDEALSDQKLHRLEVHLSDCADCRRFLEQSRRIDSALLGLPQVQASSYDAVGAGLRRRISKNRNGFAAKQPARLRWALSLPGLAPALVLSVGLFVGAFIGKQIVAPGWDMKSNKNALQSYRAAEVVLDLAGYQVAIEAVSGMQRESSKQ